ncbi:MAG: Fic family protein [Campylobacteraceae bacterium]|jgi:Fic family protein|nr:Fic family protein [Campylobacteraceae bacterium]
MNYLDIKKIYDKYQPYHESFFENMLIKFNCESNGIEGNSLTYNETKVLIETGIASGSKPFNDYVEVLNHKYAIDIMLHFIEYRAALTEQMIFDFNKTLLKNTKHENQSGQYRKVPVSIGMDKEIASPPYLISKNMEDLFAWYRQNDNMDLVEKISIFHVRFERIHPFIDGNGRTGRLILNYELMKEGYPPLILERTQRREYYDALGAASYSSIIGFIKASLINSMKYILESHLKNIGFELEIKNIE